MSKLSPSLPPAFLTTNFILEGSNGHTNKGHKDEKRLKVMNFRVFSGCFQDVFRVFSESFRACSGCFQGVFRVFFPMPFRGMPLGPFSQWLSIQSRSVEVSHHEQVCIAIMRCRSTRSLPSRRSENMLCMVQSSNAFHTAAV